MKFLVITLVVVAGLFLGGLLFAWSGVYNIAATEPHWKLTERLLEMLRNRSIAMHSDALQLPNLEDPDYRQAAVGHYHDTCRHCHGAPGFSPAEFAQGLYPSPPALTAGTVQRAFSDAEVYWIVQHGLKMTGMPAFGPTHEDRELRGIAALTMELSQLSAEQYARLRADRDKNAEEGQSDAHGADDGHGH